MKYKNLIFDLDGTLWDSTETLILNWNEALKDYDFFNEPLAKNALDPYMGLLIEDALYGLFPDIKESQVAEIVEELNRTESEAVKKHGGKIYEGVIEILKKMAENYELYIVSNCQEGYIEAFLDYFELWDLFKDFESHGATGKDKPENIGLVLKRNNLKTSESIYIGDTQKDYDSAIANGLDFIFCNYGFGQIKQEENVFVAESFKDILKFV